MVSVLHVCTDFWPSTGGIQQFVREQATRGAGAGVNSSVLCFNRVKGVTGKLPAVGTLDGVPIHRVGFLDLKYYKPTMLPLGLIRSHDVVHVHGIGAPLDYVAATKCLHRRAIVVSTHGGIFHTQTLAGLKQLYFRAVVRQSLRRADFVAADSASDLALFSPICSHVKLFENAVDVAPLLALPMNCKTPATFLYVGRLSDNKGIPLLLNALSVAKQSGASFQLRIVGPDVEGKRANYEELVRQQGLIENVVFVGEVTKATLLQEYASATIFVSASQYEGFGLSAVEAKAAGCRLLLHRNDSFAALFDGSPSATLIDFNDTAAAARSIMMVLQDGSDLALQESARLETRTFSWEHKMAEWAALYRSVAVAGR